MPEVNDKPETVEIECDTPSGLVLQIFREQRGEFGNKTFVPDGEPLSVKSGRQSIDATFWRRWLDQHKDNSALVEVIREVK